MREIVWMEVKVPVIVELDEDCFFVYCPNHVATQGRTKKEALANIKDALELYLDERDDALELNE